MTLTYGSLCSGYGGLDMGVQSVLGGETSWFCEFDKAPSRILAHHWPDVPNLGDMTKVDWAGVPPVDVMTGGTPCQDLSHAGKRAGMTTGTRSNLWVQMREAIAVIRPSLVVWENVRGAYSAEAASDLEQCPRCVGDPRDRGPVLRALGRVLGDLSDLGYDAWWYGLRAADVGACHGRFRVFVFAADAERGGWDGWAHEPFGRPEGRVAAAGSGAVPRDLTLLPTPRTSDTNGAGTHGDGGLDLRTVAALLPTPAVNDMGVAYTPEQWDEWTARMKAKHGNGNGRGPSLSVEAQRLLPTPTSADAKASGAAGYSGNEFCTLTDATVRRPQSWGDYEAAIRRHEAVLGRPAPAPTETGPKGGQRLSPAFVNWMMMLPDGHVTDPAIGISRNDQLKALGNGVVPPQAAAATRWWLAQMRAEVAA